MNVVSETLALEILGEGKVITARQATTAWNTELPNDLYISFTEADLQNAALDNASGKADFRLVRILGLWSLHELHARFGIDSKKQPCFYKDSKWWLGSGEDKWGKRKPIPDYYLLDFAGKWGAISWDDQEVQINASSVDFHRADECVLTEAVFTIFQLTGERLLETWYHWGPTRDSYGYRVIVGNFLASGLSVGSCDPSCDVGGRLRVVRSRKFSR